MALGSSEIELMAGYRAILDPNGNGIHITMNNRAQLGGDTNIPPR